MKRSVLYDILIVCISCFIAVFVTVRLLQDAKGYTGGEQEIEPAETPPPAAGNTPRTQQASFLLVAGQAANPAAVKTMNPKKTAMGREFTKFGITPDMFMEGHWWGMEAENLTPIARRILRIPPDIRGLWIDETNLWAVRSGIESADILMEINGSPVRDLGEFYQLTKRFRNRRKVRLKLLRGDTLVSVVLAPGPPLGIAAMESADALDPMTSDAAVDPLDLVEEAPPDFPQRGYKALVSPKGVVR